MSTKLIIKSKYLYSIQLDDESNIFFINSLIDSKLLNDYTTSVTKMLSNITTLNFCAKNVKVLSDLISIDYNLAVRMMWCLNIQNISLYKYGYGFYCLNPSDILVINSDIFICTNINFIKKITNDTFILRTPFLKNTFISPELYESSTLPTICSTNCFYYSIAALIIYCLFDTNICTNICTNKFTNKLLEPIAQTKLYWSLLKCLNLESKKRCLLFI